MLLVTKTAIKVKVKAERIHVMRCRLAPGGREEQRGRNMSSTTAPAGKLNTIWCHLRQQHHDWEQYQRQRERSILFLYPKSRCNGLQSSFPLLKRQTR